MVNFFESSGNGRSRNEKLNGAAPPMRRLEEAKRTYAKALVGKGYEKEIVILGRDSMGNEENRTLRKVDDFGKKDTLMLPENQAGEEAGTFPSIDKEIFLDFSRV